MTGFPTLIGPSSLINLWSNPFEAMGKRVEVWTGPPAIGGVIRDGLASLTIDGAELSPEQVEFQLICYRKQDEGLRLLVELSLLASGAIQRSGTTFWNIYKSAPGQVIERKEIMNQLEQAFRDMRLDALRIETPKTVLWRVEGIVLESHFSAGVVPNTGELMTVLGFVPRDLLASVQGRINALTPLVDQVMENIGMEPLEDLPSRNGHRAAPSLRPRQATDSFSAKR